MLRKPPYIDAFPSTRDGSSCRDQETGCGHVSDPINGLLVKNPG